MVQTANTFLACAGTSTWWPCSLEPTSPNSSFSCSCYSDPPKHSEADVELTASPLSNTFLTLSSPLPPPSHQSLSIKVANKGRLAYSWGHQMTNESQSKKRGTKSILYRPFIAYRSSFHLQLFSIPLMHFPLPLNFQCLCIFSLSLSLSISHLSTACLYQGTDRDLCAWVCVYEFARYDTDGNAKHLVLYYVVRCVWVASEWRLKERVWVVTVIKRQLRSCHNTILLLTSVFVVSPFFTSYLFPHSFSKKHPFLFINFRLTLIPSFPFF